MLMHMLTMLAATATPISEVGVGVAAPTTVKTDPKTYELAGFRLGMSEDQVQQAIRARSMTVKSKERVVDFETKVRMVLNAQDHGAFRETGNGVLGSVTLDDGQGGQVALHLLGWADGAHVSSITYIAPRGTAIATWRDMLVAKYGVPGESSPNATYQATWCGGVKDCFDTADRFRLVAAVGPDGGTVALTQPESTAGDVPEAVRAEVARRARGGRPSL